MSNRSFFCLTAALVLAVIVGITPAAQANSNLIGIGVHYWQTIDKLHEDFDRNGLSWLATYQRNLNSLVGVQADLEWFPTGFGGTDKNVFAPQCFLVIGGALYGGLGIGILYSEGVFNDKPYYALRAGFEMEILPTVHLDINFNYQFSEWDKINRLDKELRSDTIFMGSALRIEF